MIQHHRGRKYPFRKNPGPFWASVLVVAAVCSISTAAIIQAVIPQVVPTANKTASAGTIFQLAKSTTPGSAGQSLCDDGTGQATYTGCTVNAVTSTSPVTVNTNTTSDQELMELSLSAGYLNSLGRPFDFFGAGVYTTQSGQTPTLDFKIKLCTVSGCGSGTVVTLVNITTGATIAASTNISWNLRALGVISTAGATGNLEIHGPATVDLGSALSTAATVYNDTNTAVSSNIDLTAALFVDFTVAFSTNTATANTCTQRSGVVSPGGSTSGGGGGSGAMTQISKQVLGSAASSITFSSIPGTFNSLFLTLQGRGDNASNNVNPLIRFNGDSGTNYDWFSFNSGGNSNNSSDTSGLLSAIPAANATANFSGSLTVLVPNYAATTFFKNSACQQFFWNGSGTTSGSGTCVTNWHNTAAVNSITLILTAGNYITGTTAVLYGLN